MRILSLTPEATAILGALGLGDQIVEEYLGADLVFTSETESGGVPRAEVRRAIAGLQPRPAVYALEPHSLGDILSDVKTVGDATGRQREARALIEALRARIDAVSLRAARHVAEHGARRVVCLASSDPSITAGWWLAELVGLAGGLDVFDGVGRPPRAVTRTEIEAAEADMVMGGAEILLDGASMVVAGPGAVGLLERLADRILGPT